MKKFIILSQLLLLSLFALAQTPENDFIKQSGSGTLDTGVSERIVGALKKDPKGKFIAIADSILKFPGRYFDAPSIPLNEICTKMTATDNVFSKISEGNSDYAIIFVYRKMKMDTSNGQISADLATANTLIYHKVMRGDTAKFDNYLLATKKLYIIYIDRADSYFEENEADQDKKLSGTEVKIDYRINFTRQSMKDLITVIGGVSKAEFTTVASKAQLQLTIVQIDPKRVKAPCEIVLSNKSFGEDKKFMIHEKNIASFQVGLVNNKYSRNNFAITGGNLVVSPDTAQEDEWKSNMYASFEMHLPRDIDNFRPIWKTAFTKDPEKRGTKHWFYAMTLERIGIYGGLKISKDPLSNIYYGFNYAITKELYINAGWTIANEVVPQVTDIGEVTSLDDAVKYARRDYGKPKFSWGFSFAPSQIIAMFGIKGQTEN